MPDNRLVLCTVIECSHYYMQASIMSSHYFVQLSLGADYYYVQSHSTIAACFLQTRVCSVSVVENGKFVWIRSRLRRNEVFGSHSLACGNRGSCRKSH